MMLLTPVPWAKRVWALPFLTVLAPSERYHEQRQQRHKTITDWARQMIRQLCRWLPKRALVVVADGSYAVLDFLAAVIHSPQISVITRLRLDAALYDPAPERTSNTKGRPALKGKRQPTLAKRLADPAVDCDLAPLWWIIRNFRTVDTTLVRRLRRGNKCAPFINRSKVLFRLCSHFLYQGLPFRRSL